MTVMTKGQYRAALKKLGFSHAVAGITFQCSSRQSQKYAAGDAPVPRLLAKVIDLLLAGKLTTEDLR